MRRHFFCLSFIAVALFGTGSLLACIWDRDTLATEAKSFPDLLQVLVGDFPRNPPAYYSMRLERVKTELAADPTRLDLYDDAGAAADRLHLGDEAIEFMNRKALALENHEDGEAKKEHTYRYHANLGTFLIHRWLRTGAKLETLEQANAAREHIASAIEINPDAHFGRERYQLLAIDWIIAHREGRNPHEEENVDKNSFLKLPKYPGNTRSSELGFLAEKGFPDAIQGIAGLIVLGDAWESADVFHTLATALQAENLSSLALLADRRARDLIDAGAMSFGQPDDWITLGFSIESTTPHLEWYAEAREIADQNQQTRSAHLTKAFNGGRHPDTDSAFWDDFQIPLPLPEPPDFLLPRPPRLTERWISIAGWAFCLVAVGLVGGAFLSFYRWRKQRGQAGNKE